MSVKLSSWVWDGCAAQGVKGIKLLVMARLADFSSDEGVCWPSVATIARQLGAGRSTVITAIPAMTCSTENPASISNEEALCL